MHLSRSRSNYTLVLFVQYLCFYRVKTRILWLGVCISLDLDSLHPFPGYLFLINCWDYDAFSFQYDVVEHGGWASARCSVQSQGQIRGQIAPSIGWATFGWAMMISMVKQGSSLSSSPTSPSLNPHYNRPSIWSRLLPELQWRAQFGQCSLYRLPLLYAIMHLLHVWTFLECSWYADRIFPPWVESFVAVLGIHLALFKNIATSGLRSVFSYTGLPYMYWWRASLSIRTYLLCVSTIALDAYAIGSHWSSCYCSSIALNPFFVRVTWNFYR